MTIMNLIGINQYDAIAWRDQYAPEAEVTTEMLGEEDDEPKPSARSQRAGELR